MIKHALICFVQACVAEAHRAKDNAVHHAVHICMRIFTYMHVHIRMCAEANILG